jgi:hypothetical protein
MTTKPLTLEYEFSGFFEIPEALINEFSPEKPSEPEEPAKPASSSDNENTSNAIVEKTAKFDIRYKKDICEKKYLSELMKTRQEISQATEERIKHLLPEGTAVQVKYHFDFSNSIAFTATVLLIFNWVSPIVLSAFEGELKQRITEGISTIIRETLDFFVSKVLGPPMQVHLDLSHSERDDLEIGEGHPISPFMPDWLIRWQKRERFTSAILGLISLLLVFGMVYLFTKDFTVIRKDQLPLQEQTTQ